MVTQPLEKPVSETPMAKVTTTQASTTDTLITLKKSGKVLMLPKGLSAKQIGKLDKFLSQNKTPAATASLIRPNAEMCGWHTTYGWEEENQFQPMPGKHLGIWVTPDVISFSVAHNTYGFDGLFINWGDSLNAASAGFQPSNIMIGLDPYEPINDIADHGAYGYYYFDEAYENDDPQGNIIAFENAVAVKNPNAKVLISDYFWPEPHGYCMDNGHGIWNTNTMANYNSGIMCDQYYLDDCNGTMVDFWNEYFNFYGSSKSFANWMDNTMNNAGGWSSCFSWANEHNLNQVWLYALHTGDEGVIVNYCNTAWQTGWLLRKSKQIAFVWQCTYPNPCTSCIWGSTDISMWNVVSWHYTGVEQYFAY